MNEVSAMSIRRSRLITHEMSPYTQQNCGARFTGAAIVVAAYSHVNGTNHGKRLR